MGQKVYDCVIVGGSAASTAAAIYAVRRNLDFLLLAKEFGGEVATSGEIANYPGFSHTDGLQLSDAFRAHLKSYNVQPELGVTISKIEKKDGIFTLWGVGCRGPRMASEKVDGDDGMPPCVYKTKTVIVATGAHPRELGVPGEKEFRNKGLSYCTVCDGPLFHGKKVATIGAGNSALESALMLKDIAEHVTLVNIKKEFVGDSILIGQVTAASNVEILYEAKTTEIIGDTFVTGLRYLDMKTGEGRLIPASGIFVHIGIKPNSDLFPSDVERTARGEIVVDTHMRTSVPGLFAAGDVVALPYRQIGIAVGHGITAALEAVTYLQQNQVS